MVKRNLRVLHVIASDGRRGAEIFASDLIRALNGARIDQMVGVLRESANGHEVRAAYEAPTAILGAGASQVPTLGVELRSLRRLHDLVDSYRPHVVQAHGGEALKNCVLSAAGRRASIIYRRIGSAPDRISRGPRRLAYASLMRRARRVVAVSDAVRRQTIALFGLPAEKVVMIPSGVDIRRMAPSKTRRSTRAELGLPGDAPLIVTLSALAAEKDPLGHLDVMQEVLRRRPDATYVFAGDGPMRSRMQKAIEDLGLSQRVSLLGARSDVADLLAASDIHMLASRTEGMPGCLIEAGLVGLPVAAYDIAGIPEVVDDGVTGVLAPFGHSAQLAERIVELLHRPELRQQMGRAARDRCRASFDISPIANRYLELYRPFAA
jgi:glycosyltransferase involved in cell wall biosynthesis